MAALVTIASVLVTFPLLGAGSCESGRALFGARDYAAAQTALWGCILSGAASKDFAYQLALTYRERRNYAEGLERAAQAVSKNPGSVDLRYVLAYLQFRTQRHDDSLRTLEQIYRLDANDWRIHHLFGLNYVVLGKKEGAAVSLENAVRLNPGNPELHYQLARFYYSDNRVHESLAESERALRIYPGYGEVYDNVALCYEAMAEPENAKASYERAISLAVNEWPFLDFAAFLIKQGDAAGSLPLTDRALRLNPGSAKAQYLRGRAMHKLGRVAESKLALEEAIRLDPNDGASYYELGMLLGKMGEREQSRNMLQRFKQLRR